jgi:hypothetical protein
MDRIYPALRYWFYGWDWKWDGNKYIQSEHDLSRLLVLELPLAMSFKDHH